MEKDAACCCCQLAWGYFSFFFTQHKNTFLFSDFLNLLPDDDRIVASDLFSAKLAVVERALVFVRIPVHRTIQSSTAALEPFISM